MASKTLIIAEAGVNHNGDINKAKDLILAAKEAGADIVKFQTFKADNLVTRKASKAVYQIDSLGKNESQYQMLKKLELNIDQHKELFEFCNKNKIEFLSSAFDINSNNILNELGLKRVKIPSGEITNLPYLRHISTLNKEIILSTGMSTMSEIEQAIEILESGVIIRDKITVLHCNTQYPTPLSDVNLNAMNSINKTLNVAVGYSDHTLGIEVAIGAVAKGAKIIEKHFTLDRILNGPDHKASLIPEELKQMVGCIRNIEKALGNGVKEPSKSEYENIIVARKSIIAAKKINKGDTFTNDNLTIKRPGSGISPMYIDDYIGKTADRYYEIDDIIRP